MSIVLWLRFCMLYELEVLMAWFCAHTVFVVSVVLESPPEFTPHPIDLWLFGQFGPPNLLFSPELWLWQWSFGGVVVLVCLSGASIEISTALAFTQSMRPGRPGGLSGFGVTFGSRKGGCCSAPHRCISCLESLVVLLREFHSPWRFLCISFPPSLKG